MARERLTILHVFISSPSDCLEEREIVGQVIETLNESETARRARIALKAIRWENLTPGETKEHDYQGRLNDLLKRAGLHRYDIYVGFMRERIGSETLRAKSGTIEEFDSARKTRRLSGAPAELLFYFLRPEQRPPSSADQFRAELRTNGFLYSDTPTRELFAERLTHHLTAILDSWRGWPRVVRRQLRNIQGASVLFLLFALAAYILVGAWTTYRVNNLLWNEEPEQAIELFATRMPYLPGWRDLVRDKIQAAIKGVAADRITGSLLAQSHDPFRWKIEHLRPFEVLFLTQTARERLSAGTSSKRDAGKRLAWVALAEDWRALRRDATTELERGENPVNGAVSGFMTYAPSDQVVQWLREDLPSKISTPAAGRILDRAAQRRHGAITFEALEALGSGRLGTDAHDFDLNLFCDVPDQDCPGRANRLLGKWLLEPHMEPPVNALGVILLWATPARMSVDERKQISDRLVKLLTAKRYQPVSQAIIYFLAKAENPDARRAVLERVAAHRDGRISFGMAERRSLLLALPQLEIEHPDLIALTIAQRSEREVRGLKGAAAAIAPDDAAVQGAYLYNLAVTAHVDWSRHRAWIDSLLERRMRDYNKSFYVQDFDAAFEKVVQKLGSAWLLEKMRSPRPPVVDSMDGGLSSRRGYFLRMAAKTPEPFPPELSGAVCAALPALESQREGYYLVLAKRGGALGRSCLKDQMANDPGVLRFVAVAGDNASLVRYLMNAKGESVERTLSAAGELGEAQQREFLDEAVRQLPKSRQAELWSFAGARKLSSAPLVEGALESLRVSEDSPRVIKAIDFLADVRPELAWQALERPDVAERFRMRMGKGELWDWILAVQALPVPATKNQCKLLVTIAGDRRVLVGYARSQTDASALLRDRAMSVGSLELVSNPLLRRISVGCLDPESTRFVFGERALTGARVESFSPTPNDEITYRAYMTWLAAERLTGEGKAPYSVTSDDLLTLVRDSNPVSSRALAGLLLAAYTK